MTCRMVLYKSVLNADYVAAHAHLSGLDVYAYVGGLKYAAALK